MRTTVLTLAVTATSLYAVSAAQADRSGQAPIRDPHILDSQHVSFTLLGAGWGQARGQTGATPEAGRYGQSQISGCRMTANVSATVMAHAPKVTRSRVDVPGYFRPIRITDRGRSHGIKWWVGSQAGVRVAAVGYQRAASTLSRHGHGYLVYEVVLRGVSKDPSCTMTEGRRTARTITRSMHVTQGAIRVRGPYYP